MPETTSKPKPESGEVETAAEFHAALRLFLRTVERMARDHGLTPQRYFLMLMIYAAPGRQSTVSELGERLQLAQSTATELVARAERVGLIDRSDSPDDARRSMLTLSAEGEARLLRVFAALTGERRHLAEAFSHASALQAAFEAHA
ncbi:MAG TPA: MarR family transcriptional regulator [Gaiellaceae bacterium]